MVPATASQQHGRVGLRGQRVPRNGAWDLRKNELKPWRNQQWVIPPQANAAFVSRMEEVLDVYTRPYDPKRPMVCMDETSKQLIGETRLPLPSRSGQLQRYDYEYVRHGVSNLFMLFEPLQARRYVKVTDRRTSQDWAQLMRQLVDEHYPEAEVVTLVLDNLNTHTPASLYQTFEPEEARRIARRLEIHYTPKHGSWLNMAEI